MERLYCVSTEVGIFAFTNPDSLSMFQEKVRCISTEFIDKPYETCSQALLAYGKREKAIKHHEEYCKVLTEYANTL